MPDLAEPQTSLKQAAKSHPLTFIDARCIQHQPTPFCFQPRSSRGKGGDPIPSVPLTGSQTKGHSLYFPSLDGCQKRQVRNSADRDRKPSSSSFDSTGPHLSVFRSNLIPHPSQREVRPSVGSSLAAILSSHKQFLEKAQIFSSRVVRLSRSSGLGVPSPSSGSGTTAGTRYGAQARGCARRLVATFTGV